MEIVDVPERHRYEARIDGEVAGHLRYALDDGVITLIHTEASPEFEGQGVGSSLAQGALDDARRRGLRVVAKCEFVADWIDKHPDYADLVAGTSLGT